MGRVDAGPLRKQRLRQAATLSLTERIVETAKDLLRSRALLLEKGTLVGRHTHCCTGLDHE